MSEEEGKNATTSDASILSNAIPLEWYTCRFDELVRRLLWSNMAIFVLSIIYFVLSIYNFELLASSWMIVAVCCAWTACLVAMLFMLVSWLSKKRANATNIWYYSTIILLVIYMICIVNAGSACAVAFITSSRIVFGFDGYVFAAACWTWLLCMPLRTSVQLVLTLRRLHGKQTYNDWNRQQIITLSDDSLWFHMSGIMWYIALLCNSKAYYAIPDMMVLVGFSNVLGLVLSVSGSIAALVTIIVYAKHAEKKVFCTKRPHVTAAFYVFHIILIGISLVCGIFAAGLGFSPTYYTEVQNTAVIAAFICMFVLSTLVQLIYDLYEKQRLTDGFLEHEHDVPWIKQHMFNTAQSQLIWNSIGCAIIACVMTGAFTRIRNSGSNTIDLASLWVFTCTLIVALVFDIVMKLVPVQKTKFQVIFNATVLVLVCLVALIFVDVSMLRFGASAFYNVGHASALFILVQFGGRINVLSTLWQYYYNIEGSKDEKNSLVQNVAQ